MFKDININTKHLIIKPYSMDDIDDLYKVYSDEKSVDCNPKDVEIFYGLSSEYWGSGLAMLNYGFNIIGIKRIVAMVNSNNIASKKSN